MLVMGVFSIKFIIMKMRVTIENGIRSFDFSIILSPLKDSLQTFYLMHIV